MHDYCRICGRASFELHPSKTHSFTSALETPTETDASK